MDKNERDAGFRVEQIDHVELHVPDRKAAAAWYQDVLGLQVVPEFEFWSSDPRGPLMIATEMGGTKLALFEGQPEGSQKGIGFYRTAFRVNGKAFAAFVQRLPELKLRDNQDKIVTAGDVTDHQKALSIYFCDPWGHCLEITTYEVQDAAIE